MWAGLVFRAAQLQILPNDKLEKLQRKQYKTLVKLPARRGAILDRNGKELAVSVPAYSLFADPKIIKNSNQVARRLGRLLRMDVNYFKRKFKDKNKRFVWLKRNLSQEYRDKVRGLGVRGLGFVEESKRIYPNSSMLAQALGFVGREAKGLEGLELAYDAQLRGESKSVKIERDARGRPLLVDGRVFAEMPAGYDVELSIDSELQFVVEKALADTVVSFDADTALGIVMDPKTNEILAMAHAPGFDANRALKVAPKLWRNRIVTDIMEPGSVIKPLVVAGAIRDGVVKPNTKIDCEGGRMRVGQRTIREADGHHVFGKISVSEVLAKSSNVGTSKVALKMGAKHVHRVLQEFGFGETTGLGMPGEAKGILNPLPWSKHLTATSSFGHGIATTALQVANAYSALANDGVLRTPVLVKGLQHPETGEYESFRANVIRRVLSEEEASTMRLMLTQVVQTGGTGLNARVTGFPVAGKTGTAQKVSASGGYEKGAYISSFVGMIPANDPKYVILVSVDNPREKYYGSDVAAPLFSRIAGYAIRKSGMAPVLISEKNLVKKKDQSQAKAIHKIRNMTEALKSADTSLAPNLEGLYLREVMSRIRGTNIKIRFKGSGVVSKMEPEAGEPLPDDKTIQLNLEPAI